MTHSIILSDYTIAWRMRHHFLLMTISEEDNKCLSIKGPVIGTILTGKFRFLGTDLNFISLWCERIINCSALYGI